MDLQQRRWSWKPRGGANMTREEVLEPMAIDEPIEGDREMGNTDVPAFHFMDIDMLEVTTAMDQGDIFVGEARLASQAQVRPEEQELPCNGGDGDRPEATWTNTSSREATQEVTPRKARRINLLCNRLIGSDAISNFADNCEKTLPDWVKLLRKITLPTNITSRDPRIIAAFKALDSVICGHGTIMLRRLANVHLMQLFGSLEAIIKFERNIGRIHREPYYRDDHIAMDIYLSAQESHSNTNDLRRKLRQNRKRFSKRWNDLAITSPLFVLVYSDAAESIMYATFAFNIPPANYRKVRTSRI
ncbi:hypothetical protein B0T14DRAFT_511794 [Immersiella caudata]|uniref:Uncharacterized protein n=1 Tax=Immersiella caudata TaxID=314043 RepID=A0AA39X4F3_9PEZI|nr:hypothetical protein B0T14DRAFT_511794 [Immersiella caudata]